MKAKIKFDQKKIKAFFVEHVEKMVLGLFAFVALWLMWSYFTLERFTRTPDELQSAAQRAREHVERQTFDAEREEIVFTDPMEMLALANQPLDPEPFRLEPWDPLLFPQRKRAEPEILAVHELEVLTEMGTFRTPQRADDEVRAGGDSTGSFSWACVVGLIPFEQQQQIFNTALRRRADAPQWYAYMVYRAAVPLEGEEPKWERLDMPEVFSKMRELTSGRSASDPVPAKYLLPVVGHPIAYPLPERIDRPWRLEEVAHSKIVSELRAEEEPAAGAESEEEPDAGEENLFGAPGAPRGGAQPARGGGMGQAAQQPRGSGMGQARQQPRGGGMGQAAQQRGGGMGQAGQQGEVQRVADAPTGPAYRLFRFFDFNVQPGQQYRYRIVLYVNNPNRRVPAQELEDPAMAEKVWLTSPYSEVSPAARIPWGAQLAFGAVEPPRGANDINVETIISQPDDRGYLGMIKKKVFRGELINFKAEPAPIFSPRGDFYESKEFAFRTETLVVDIDDGADGEGNTRVLVLSPGGRLLVRSDPDEFAKADEQLQKSKPQESTQSGGDTGDGGQTQARRGSGLGRNFQDPLSGSPSSRSDD